MALIYLTPLLMEKNPQGQKIAFYLSFLRLILIIQMSYQLIAGVLIFNYEFFKTMLFDKQPKLPNFRIKGIGVLVEDLEGCQL